MTLAGLVLILTLAGSLAAGDGRWVGANALPKASRLDPMAGLKRMFGATGWIEAGKGLIKLRLMQLAHAGSLKAGEVWTSAAGNRARWSLGEWFVEFEGNSVRYGDKSMPFVRLLAPERTSWKSSLTTTTGESRRCRPRAASLRNALVQLLPDLVKEIDFLIGALAFSPKEETRAALKFFGVHEVFPSKAEGDDPYWARARGIVSGATQNPIKALVRHLEDQFEADEVYRLFGQDPDVRGGKFPDVVMQAFNDVLSELERGYIRTRATEAQDNQEDELDELMALQKLLT